MSSTVTGRQRLAPLLSSSTLSPLICRLPGGITGCLWSAAEQTGWDGWRCWWWKRTQVTAWSSDSLAGYICTGKTESKVKKGGHEVSWVARIIFTVTLSLISHQFQEYYKTKFAQFHAGTQSGRIWTWFPPQLSCVLLFRDTDNKRVLLSGTVANSGCSRPKAKQRPRCHILPAGKAS